LVLSLDTFVFFKGIYLALVGLALAEVDLDFLLNCAPMIAIKRIKKSAPIVIFSGRPWNLDLTP